VSGGDSTFTLPEIAKLAGAEYRTLKGWVDRGFASPSVKKASGAGRADVYSARDAQVICKLVELRRRGLDIDHLEAVAKIFDEIERRLTHAQAMNEVAARRGHDEDEAFWGGAAYELEGILTLLQGEEDFTRPAGGGVIWCARCGFIAGRKGEVDPFGSWRESGCIGGGEHGPTQTVEVAHTRQGGEAS
jgi:hypothetical protein